MPGKTVNVTTHTRPARTWIAVAVALGALALGGCAIETVDDEEFTDSGESSLEADGQIEIIGATVAAETGGEEGGPEPTPWRGATDDDSEGHGPPPPPDLTAGACEPAKSGTGDDL